MSMLLSFPEGFTPNRNQQYIIKEIEKALSERHKFIVINAPTGSGKSFIAPTLANYTTPVPVDFKDDVDDYSIFNPTDGPTMMEEYGRFGAYALTITKALQDQYKETFDWTGVLKGKSNYQCMVDEEETVDVAPCLFAEGLKKECWGCNRCPYYNARNEMLKSDFSALNYSMFFSLPEHLKQRSILILDEASELEDQIVNHFTCEVDIPFLRKVGVELKPTPSSEDRTLMAQWIRLTICSVQKKLEEYAAYLDSNKTKDATFFKKRTEYSKLSRLDQKIVTLAETYFESQYILEKDGATLKFIPLKINVLADRLFRHADTVILMSATIIDHKNFTKSLGVNEYYYIEAPSLFDPKKSPIYILAKQKLNYKNLQQMLPTLVKQIEGILEEHEGDKGIIHTHTQNIANYIRDNLKSNRCLFREEGVNNEQILNLHSTSNSDTVLVSPSMAYGVDLKGDLAKFQIILKAPWLPTKDVRVEKMMKLDKQWYANKMLCTLVQASGRGSRSANDECQTYILDGTIYDAIARNKNKLPKHFVERIL